MDSIVLVHNGSHAQIATLDDPALAPYRIHAVHIRELGRRAIELDAADVVIVSDRVRPDLLAPQAPRILECAERGGTVVAFGENGSEAWLPGSHGEARATNFWWWRTGEDSRIRPRAPEHPAWAFLDAAAVTWHYHGVLHPPTGAVSLVDLVTVDGEVDGSLLYVDDVSTSGRILGTTLDPIYHHGSGFMPGATRLLYCVLQWATRPSDTTRSSARRRREPIDA